MTSYNIDKSAEALVLYDVGESSFIQEDGGFEIRFERATRIKIFSKAGLDYAKVEIPFYAEGQIFEDVYDIQAYTYNLENGTMKRTALDKSNIYEERKNEYWKVLKFAMPDVRPGSIIEFKYTLQTPYTFNLQDWSFQRSIPTAFSKYTVHMVPFYEYTYLLQGIRTFAYQNSFIRGANDKQRFGSTEYRIMTHEFVQTDVPAFKDEEFITSVNDYIMKMDFQLSKINYPNGAREDVITTWEELIKSLHKNESFGRYLKISEKSAKKLLDVGHLLTLPVTERFEAVMEYVKNNYRWNTNRAKYASKTVKEMLNDGYGNAADINLLAIGLLKAVGIEAYPVISSTRGHGTIKVDYPINSFFNYVLIYAHLGDEHVLADATEPNAANNRIPTRCLNDKGLIIDSEEGSWITLRSAHMTKTISTFNIDLTEEEQLTSVIESSEEYKGIELRGKYGEDKDVLIVNLEERGYEVIDSTVIIENFEDNKKPYVIKYTVRQKPDKLMNKIYISPFLSEVISENPLKQPKRQYPVDMVYPYQRIYSAGITIPDNYEIDYLPKAQRISNDLFELDYIVLQNENQVNINFTYYFKKPIYSTTDYPKIKFYFGDLVKAANEKIVLKEMDTTVAKTN